MTATVSKAGPYYASGEIKFSSLRSNFRANLRKDTSSGSETFIADTGEIKASDFKRNVEVDTTDPIVPDATENAEISTSTDWKTSQFRGSIKYYYITQFDFDENFNIGSPPSTATWNENLNKNIRKFLFVDGTCGSEIVSSPAMQLNSTAYNLTVDVRGSILGAGGRGGSSSGNIVSSGENGGDALEMSSPNGANNIVFVRSTARIYGGGGGGEQGSRGARGSAGLCYEETTYQGCGEVQRCPDGYSDAGTWGGRCCESTCDWCFGCCERCTKNLQYRSCYKYTGVTPGLGGAGGAGGYGRGFNNLEPGVLTGSPGQLGKEPSSITSTIGYYWTTDKDDAYLNVTGSGKARITVQIRTKDSKRIAGTSYDTVRIYDGPNTGFTLIQTWGFSNGIRTVSFDVTPKTYMVRISGNPKNVEIRDNGVKLRDNDGSDTNARIDVTLVDQYTFSAEAVCGATAGKTGEPGGSGGDWASSGSGTLSAGSAGGPGRAIFGSNYSLSSNSVISSTTIKGQR